MQKRRHFEQALAAPLKAFAPHFQIDGAAVFCGDSLEILRAFSESSVDMIFADPPYMLSNGGFTCSGGKMAAVSKGEWDKSGGFEKDAAFHGEWIGACRRALKPEGTIWVSGTYHSIYQCGYMLQKSGFRILNDIAWLKPNAPPNLSCRFFTASHETLIWARKGKSAKHVFSYGEMKSGSFPEDRLKKEGAQMRSVWSIPAPPPSEKAFGKHPAQKPLGLLARIVAASTNPGAVVLDPFCGSGTAGLACLLAGRQFVGIEIDAAYCEIAKKRLLCAAANAGGAAEP